MTVNEQLAMKKPLKAWQMGLLAGVLVIGTWVLLKYCQSAGIRHDYNRYLDQWQQILNGEPPWDSDNAYGPIHTLLAYLVPFGKMVPKYFMAGLLLIANGWLVYELAVERGFKKIQFVYLLAVPTNILFLGIGIFYGLNDTLVAAFLTFAVLLMRHQHPFAAGVMIALAGLVKYYPLALLPFFALNERKINWPTLAGGLLVFIAGFLAALAVWGDGPLTAIFFNTTRDAKLLSVLASMQSVFGDGGVTGFLIQYNVLFMGLGIALALLFAWANRLAWMEGVILGYLVMLMLYKVGNQQFYVPVLFMVSCLLLMNRQTSDRMAIALIPLAMFLSLYQYGYQFASDQYRTELAWVRAYGGFIAFAVNLASVTAVLWITRRQENGQKPVEI